MWAIGIFVAFAGAGCAVKLPDVSKIQLPSVTVATESTAVGSVTPKQAAEKILFRTGSVIVMKQGFSGIAGKLADKLGFGGSEARREISIRRFESKNVADIEWTLTTKETPDPKNPKDTGERVSKGVLNGADLLTAHKLYLPGYWSERELSAFGTSVIWVSKAVFDDLARTKKSTLNFGILDEALYGSLKAADDLKSALSKLKGQTDTLGKKQDLNVIEMDQATSTRTLTVNGKEILVQVLTARNWFGEVTVLDNAANPLVLKVALNPVMLAAADAVGGNFLRYGLGFEITELKDIRE